jgi:hypothetical protein
MSAASACHDVIEEEELDSQNYIPNEEATGTLKISATSIALEPLSLEPRHDMIERRGSQDGASNETLTVSSERAVTPTMLESPAFDPQSSCDVATFVRQKDGWAQKEQCRLKNSLLAGVGLLELANAGDFAANVWNEIPVPHFAMALSM